VQRKAIYYFGWANRAMVELAACISVFAAGLASAAQQFEFASVKASPTNVRLRTRRRAGRERMVPHSQHQIMCHYRLQLRVVEDRRTRGTGTSSSISVSQIKWTRQF
jgi:hypothetical protein